MIAGLKSRKHCEVCNLRVDGPDRYCIGCREKINEAQAWRRRRGEEPGYIYAIGVLGDENSVVKIGYARSVDARLKTLQTGSPVLLELIGRADGRVCNEKRIHRLLIGSRSHGEWFNRTPQVREVLTRITRNEVTEWLALNAQLAEPTIKHLRGQYSVV